MKSGLDGEVARIKNLWSAQRYLADKIYTALENFEKAEWTTTLLGADVKARYAELKRVAADRCPRSLGTVVKAPEVQFHHEVYNQFLWNLFYKYFCTAIKPPGRFRPFSFSPSS